MGNEMTAFKVFLIFAINFDLVLPVPTASHASTTRKCESVTTNVTHKTTCPKVVNNAELIKYTATCEVNIDLSIVVVIIFCMLCRK
jgi:hypothetical protein